MSKKEKTLERKCLEAIRSQLSTHIIEVEIDVKPKDQKQLNDILEHARIIRNTALGQAYKRYEQMVRTKKYRKLLQQYGFVCEKLNKTTDDKKIKAFAKGKEQIKKELLRVQKDYRLTENDIQVDCDKVRKKYTKALAVFGQTIKNGVWQSIETLLFKDGKGVHFRGKNQYHSLEAKQHNRTIILKRNAENGVFFVSFDGMKLPLIVKKNDVFIQETLANIRTYWENETLIEKENDRLYSLGKKPIATYRIKYNRIVRKEIRGKNRYFLQIVLEGTAVPKRKKDGSFRHTLGKGRFGGDIGTQSIAIVTKEQVELKNLAERTNPNREQQIVRLQRKMERSKRATNSDCFDANGRTIQKMHTKSKNYVKTQKKNRNMHRILAENRKYAHNEEVNRLRSLCDEGYIEIMQWKAFQKKVKEVSVNVKTGKFNRRKRFGKSILNRSPGYFVTQLKKKFTETGGFIFEVNNWTFKASQYDHLLNDCNKKQLSQRWHVFENGMKVQRDLYSAFLLYCSETDLSKPNQTMCIEKFEDFYHSHEKCIEFIKANNLKIKNSGIKVS